MDKTKLLMPMAIVVLLIGLFYTSVFSLTRGGDVVDCVQPMSETTAPPIETEAIPLPLALEGYIETSWWKAGLADYTVAETTTVATTTKPPVTTTKPPVTTTTPSVTTAPVTTTAPSVTTATVTTTAPAQTTPKPRGDTGETFSYVYGGSKKQGNAFDVVCQIVQAEMGGTFHEEALKAQAVAAYSYLKFNNAKGLSPSISLNSKVSAKVKAAVQDVFGVGIYYNGKIAQSVYSSATGGYSASAKDVWGGDIPYLESVVSEFDSAGSYYGSVKTFSQDYIKNAIQKSTGIALSGNPENWITLLPAEQGGIVDGGYVGKILIDGNATYTKSGNSITLTGRILRENILDYGLRSSKFEVSYSGGVFTFVTYGYGHGVGMSQIGANLYATKGGYNYLQILQHYFTGIEIR